jgi:uncharacterized protein (TIGR00251 family)
MTLAGAREPVRAGTAGTLVDLRVIPRSPKSAVSGVRDGRFVVRVTAPPVDRAANDAVVALLAGVLDVSRSRIVIVAGATSRNKTVQIAGAAVEAVRARLDAAGR